MNIRAIFQEVLRPELISFLYGQLQPLNAGLLNDCQDIQKVYYNTLAASLAEQYNSLSSDMNIIKEHMNSTGLTQRRIELALSGANVHREIGHSHILQPKFCSERRNIDISPSQSLEENGARASTSKSALAQSCDETEKKDSLSEV